MTLGKRFFATCVAGIFSAALTLGVVGGPATAQAQQYAEPEMTAAPTLDELEQFGYQYVLQATEAERQEVLTGFMSTLSPDAKSAIQQLTVMKAGAEALEQQGYPYYASMLNDLIARAGRRLSPRLNAPPPAARNTGGRYGKTVPGTPAIVEPGVVSPGAYAPQLNQSPENPARPAIVTPPSQLNQSPEDPSRPASYFFDEE